MTQTTTISPAATVATAYAAAVLPVIVASGPVQHVLPSGRVLTLALVEQRDMEGWLVGKRYGMSGGYYGEHSISADPDITSGERLVAHWAGYVEASVKHEAATTPAPAPRPRSYEERRDERVAKLVKQAEALPPSLLLKGPRGLTVSLKACEVFPEDPGEGVPALVALPFGRAHSTYDCATDVGYLAGGRRNRFEDVDLTPAQQEWLEEMRPVVDTFVDGWFKRIEADPSARPARPRSCMSR